LFHANPQELEQLAGASVLMESNKTEEIRMAAKSKAQQKAAGAALSAKRGEIPKSKLIGASLEMYDSMSEKELDNLASVKRAKLPERKSNGSLLKKHRIKRTGSPKNWIVVGFQVRLHPFQDFRRLAFVMPYQILQRSQR
jgi:hypothetical protein